MSVEQRAKLLEEKLKEMPVEQVVEQNQSLLLQVAERRLHDAVRRLMEGDMSAEGEIERMDAAIRANPEYERRQKEQTLAWQRANVAPNQHALATMRALVP